MAVQKSDPAEKDEEYMGSDGALEDFEQNQLAQLQSKFRCKKDLYGYLDSKVSDGAADSVLSTQIRDHSCFYS